MIVCGIIKVNGLYVRSLLNGDTSDTSECSDDNNILLCRDMYIDAKQNYTNSLNSLNDKFIAYEISEEELISATDNANYIYCTPEQIDLGEAMERLSQALYNQQLAKYELQIEIENNIVMKQKIIDAINLCP